MAAPADQPDSHLASERWGPLDPLSKNKGERDKTWKLSVYQPGERPGRQPTIILSYETCPDAFSAHNSARLPPTALNSRRPRFAQFHLAAPIAPTRRRRTSKRRPKAAVPARMISVPASWFTRPLQKSIAQAINPPTALTRRKDHNIRMPLPLELFEEFMAPLAEGDVNGLQRLDGALLPTKTTKAIKKFEYLVRKGSLSDRLFRQEEHAPSRGAGCARLRLSAAEERRGGLPQTMSMVAGNVVVKLVVPLSNARPPMLTLTFGVLTMDSQGHITWPKDFETNTAAALRKQARALLQRMIDSRQNPAGPAMSGALTGMGSTVRALPPRRTMVVVQ